MEQRGLETEYTLEGRESSGILMKGDLRILGPGEELVLGVLVAVAEGSHESSNFLNLPLSLPIQLGMVARRKSHGHTQRVKRLSRLLR